MAGMSLKKAVADLGWEELEDCLLAVPCRQTWNDRGYRLEGL